MVKKILGSLALISILLLLGFNGLYLFYMSINWQVLSFVLLAIVVASIMIKVSARESINKTYDIH